ncbi:uncharacterized protein [Henckelia pumila]|uniref:uncharacterized protein n=1 Tax=Henckelia pumila TaxID=405737 RepID=UPI003C6E62BC
MAENEPPRGDGEENNGPPTPRSMMDCAQPSINGSRPIIIRPKIHANQFKIKPAIIQMIHNTVQFVGSALDDPNAPIAIFLEICDTFKHQGVSDDAVHLRLFPFSLRDKDKAWLNCLPADAAVGGNLLRKSPEEGYELLEEIASSSYHPQSERNISRRTTGLHQVDAITAMSAQLEALTKKIDGLSMGNYAMRIQEVFCDKCGGEHFTQDFQDDNPFYVPHGMPVKQVGSQNHPRNNPYSNSYNSVWRQHPKFSWGGQNNQYRPQGNQNYGKQPQEEKSSLEQMMRKFMSSTETRMHNQDSSIKNLENQIGQLEKAMSNRELGTLPRGTEKNPKEQVKAVELRSGKKLKAKVTEQNENQEEGDQEASTDSLLQMPSYANFLKEILSNKRKIEAHAMVKLTENCSALVQNKIPPRLKDSGSFSIPCVIGNISFHKALCDLGASINLIPFFVFN